MWSVDSDQDRGDGMKCKSELQITFVCNAYFPPYFFINADFQNLKLYFHPLYFFRNA